MRIGIVGGTGGMGRLFRRLFEKEAQVLILSRRTKLKKEQLASSGDVVLVSEPYGRQDALLCDLTSIKRDA